MVASNKVGHFIYGLHDRVWPDFVCHFSLYRGDAENARARIDETASAWFLGAFDTSLSPAKSLVVHRDLSFLSNSKEAAISIFFC